jgi:vitamin B12 transporter
VTPRQTIAVLTCLAIPVSLNAFAAEAEETISEITVTASRVANTRPAGTYATPVTQLRYDPLTELQSRGLPEGQADVTVRGGLFDNTGFRTGAVTVMDPQTGHYAAELPIDPAWLSSPQVLTGIDNTAAGFNANIATIAYTFPVVEDGGTVLAGVGNDKLGYESLRASQGWTHGGGDWQAAVSLAGSKGDGTVEYGDHDFKRYGVHLQRRDADGQSDILFGYQDKFYGWPGAYTGFATLPETDHTKTTLLLANHRAALDNGTLEIGAFYRRLVDDYDFDRRTQESGAPGSFDHETRVYGIGFDGRFGGGGLAWHVAGQATGDELVRSTDLIYGHFDSRNYLWLSVVPSIDFDRGDGRSLSLRFGARADRTNRDGSAISPVLGVTFEHGTAQARRWIALEYASSSQVPGYTALNSAPAGLFGGNPDLGRETARQLMLTVGGETRDWSGRVTAFYRRDDALVDWTYASGAPFARQANAVDLDVTGLQGFLSRQWDAVDLTAGYTWLDKTADYGTALVDASFYALNFARQRATLALRCRFGDGFELLFDNEYRLQEKNPLRSGSETAWLSSLALTWEPPDGRGFGFELAADNLTDDDFQQFPGTPAVGRQVSLSARYAW